MAENPFKSVVQALADQTLAIGKLAREIQTEFEQYQNAVANQDEAQANAIAAAINRRTARLTSMADDLAASVPDAEVGGGPATPPPSAGNELPGEQPGVDNELPERERPVDPGYGQGRPPTDPGFGNPGGGGRPDRPGNELPVPPTDPGFGNPGGSGARIRSIDPNETGPVAVDVTVSGSNFVDGDSVRVGGNKVVTQFGSDSELTASLPSGLPAGEHDVDVVNAAGEASNAVTLTILGAEPRR